MTTPFPHTIQPAMFVWHVSFSRAGLVPILIFDCIIAYFYYAWRFTDGRDGLPSKYTLALLVAVHGLQIFVFLLEVTARTCQWVWSNLNESARYLLRRVCVGPLGLVVFLGLCVFIADSYIRASDPYSEGSVHTQSGIAMYKLYHHDKSIHYYMERKDPRDGIVVILLCTSGSSRLIEKTYVRCLYQKPGDVMGRPPMRTPEQWVTTPLTQQDTEVFKALKKHSVLK